MGVSFFPSMLREPERLCGRSIAPDCHRIVTGGPKTSLTESSQNNASLTESSQDKKGEGETAGVSPSRANTAAAMVPSVSCSVPDQRLGLAAQDLRLQAIIPRDAGAGGIC